MKWEYLSFENETPLEDKTLNNLGEKRWELISFMDNGSVLYYVFKREVISKRLDTGPL